MGWLRRKVLIMPAHWKRGFVCIIPYLELMGRYAWLNAKYNELQGRYMGLKRSGK